MTPLHLQHPPADLSLSDELSLILLNCFPDKADLSCRVDDDFLLRFLRARRFNVDRAYTLVNGPIYFIYVLVEKRLILALD